MKPLRRSPEPYLVRRMAREAQQKAFNKPATEAEVTEKCKPMPKHNDLLIHPRQGRK